MNHKLLIIVLSLLASSCGLNPPKWTGQRFTEDQPTLYLSLAPSFQKPYEYVIKDRVLTFNEYDGLGGYDWGVREQSVSSKLSQEQHEKIKLMSLKAIEVGVSKELEPLDIVWTDGTTWYLQVDYKSFIAVRISNPTQKEFHDLAQYLSTIVEPKLNKSINFAPSAPDSQSAALPAGY